MVKKLSIMCNTITILNCFTYIFLKNNIIINNSPINIISNIIFGILCCIPGGMIAGMDGYYSNFIFNSFMFYINRNIYNKSIKNLNVTNK
jgi:hypothetical protein